MSTVYPLLLALCLVLVALFSASEAVLAASNRVRLRHLLRAQQTDDQSGASILSAELSGDAQKFIATVTIAANIPLVAASALAIWLGYQNFGPRLAFGISLGIALFTITFFQVTPRLMVSAPGALDRLWWVRPARLLVFLLRPLVGLMLLLGRLILTPSGLLEGPRPRTKPETSSEFLDLVQSANAGSKLEESKELIESIFTFGDTRLHEVMIPRPDIEGLPVQCDATTALNLFQETGLSRLPLYEESIDRVEGILHVKDVLACIARGESEFSPRQLLRQPLYLPETQKIDEALATMRSKRTHLAIVIDEFGGTAGLLTVEDILEELVGEIADEHDGREEESLLILDETTALADARLHTDDLKDRWGLELPVGEFDTVGGVMIEHLGRALGVGDTVEIPGAVLTVLSLRGRRPRRIKIVRLAPGGAETAAEPESGSNRPARTGGATGSNPGHKFSGGSGENAGAVREPRGDL